MGTNCQYGLATTPLELLDPLEELDDPELLELEAPELPEDELPDPPDVPGAPPPPPQPDIISHRGNIVSRTEDRIKDTHTALG